jgi:hypothetical protein
MDTAAVAATQAFSFSMRRINTKRIGLLSIHFLISTQSRESNLSSTYHDS